MDKRNIPQIIHYCWFGGNEKPDNIKYYIDGWKKILPKYEFMEWNESNFSIADAPVYVQEAYKVRKFAFVSDYVRIKALKEYGGIYLDTDIEILRPFDEVLAGREMVLCFESDRSLETAFIACCKGNEHIAGFCETYRTRRFINEDGSYDMSVINEHFSKYMETVGVDLEDETYRLIEDGKIAIYPREYFAAFDIGNWHIKPTKNTYTIHHMNSSWSSKKKKVYFATIHFLQKILGYQGYDRVKAMYDKVRGKHEKNK